MRSSAENDGRPGSLSAQLCAPSSCYRDVCGLCRGHDRGKRPLRPVGALGACTVLVLMAFAAFVMVGALAVAHCPDNLVDWIFSKGSER